MCNQLPLQSLVPLWQLLAFGRILAVLARLDQQHFLSYVALLVGGEELLPSHCKLTISLFVRATLRALGRPQTHCILSLPPRFKPAQTSRRNTLQGGQCMLCK